MKTSTTPSCPTCQRYAAELAASKAELAASKAELAASKAELAALKEQLAGAKKDSTTSSKPPSSDIVKPQQTSPSDDGSKRSIGGQPGHPMHTRQPFAPEQIDESFEHTLDACPDCGSALHRNGHLAKVVQQIDIGQPPLTIHQHTRPEYWCEHCRKAYTAALPSHIQKGGLVGEQLTTLIAFMKGVCHASFSTIRKFLRDVVGVTICRSQLNKIINKVSEALAQPYDELLRLLPEQKVLASDETGHKENGRQLWTWCLRAELFTLYHIDVHRSADVLMSLLGKEFAGILGCDYFSAYRRYMRECGVEVQFCLAHLIRDVKFLTTLPDERDRRYGEQLRAGLKELFEVIHQRETLSDSSFQARLRAVRDRLLRIGRRGPPTRHGQNMQKRFVDHGQAYFTFITSPGVGPTNNLAEQAIRFVVIDRHITQGTRSETGRLFCERIWTVIATCGQQGRSVWQFLRAAVGSWFEGTQAPSLLPVT